MRSVLDLVIQAFFTNDVLDNSRTEGKPYFALTGDGIELRNVPVRRDKEKISYVELVDSFGHQFYTHKILRAIIKRFFHPLLISLGIARDSTEGQVVVEAQKLSRSIILKLRDAVREDGGSYMMLWIPHKFEFYEARLSPVMQKVIDVKNRLLAMDFAWPALYLGPLFEEALADSGKSFYQEIDGWHWNDAGNRFVAEVVAQYLESSSLPPFATP